MPLEKGAKPGSEGFSRNVATEVKAGKPTKQAVAIAYREARNDMSSRRFKDLTDLLDEFFREEAEEPEHKKDNAENGSASLIDAVQPSPLAGSAEGRAEKMTKTDGEMLMDALDSLRGRVEVAAASKKDGFEENKHPRDENGKFGSGGGSSSGNSEKTKTSASALKDKLSGMSKDKLHASLKNPNVDPAIKKYIEKELDDRANRGA